MTCYSILSKIARLNFIRNILKYYLCEFTSDVILDYGNHYLIILQNQPGVLFFKIETTSGIPSHFEIFLRSKGKISCLGVFMFDHNFPINNTNKLTLVKNNEQK